MSIITHGFISSATNICFRITSIACTAHCVTSTSISRSTSLLLEVVPVLSVSLLVLFLMSITPSTATRIIDVAILHLGY